MTPQLVVERRRRWRVIVAVAMISWSLVRTVIIWVAIGGYGLNPWLYLVIDLSSAVVDSVTTPSMVVRFIDDRFRAAAGWAAISLGAFLVPDVYIFVGTQRLPPGIIAMVATIVTLTLTVAVVGVVRKVHAGRALRAALSVDEGQMAGA